jgi:hypothetical protein
MISQAMAPIRPPQMTYTSTALGSISLLLIVSATPVPKKKAAIKLKNAAQSTACNGERTRVVTTVATELAASWKPLKKSKMRATATREKTK